MVEHRADEFNERLSSVGQSVGSPEQAAETLEPLVGPSCCQPGDAELARRTTQLEMMRSTLPAWIPASPSFSIWPSTNRMLVRL